MKRFVEGDDRKQVALLPECIDDYTGTMRSVLRRPACGSHAKPPAALPASSFLVVLRVRSPSFDPLRRYLPSTSLKSVRSW